MDGANLTFRRGLRAVLRRFIALLQVDRGQDNLTNTSTLMYTLKISIHGHRFMACGWCHTSSLVFIDADVNYCMNSVGRLSYRGCIYILALFARRDIH